MPEHITLDITEIKKRPEFRTRKLDPNTVERYRKTLDELPSIEVWLDPETGETYLVDGEHRLEAHITEKYTDINVIYLEGTYEDMYVRARSRNMLHGLAYDKKQWQQVIEDIVKVRYHRTNTWIAQEAGCSQPTVSRVRAKLEEAGAIPRLEVLEAENGQQVHRHPKTEALDEPVEEEESTEIETAAEQKPGSESEITLGEEEEEETGQAGQGMGANGTAPKTNGTRLEDDELPADRGPREATKIILRLAQLGESLASEAGMWVDGELQPIPVTLIISSNLPPKGLSEAAPGYENCLIIGQALAEKLRLLI
ncbi:MAG: hypothetical protein BroJett011_59400 [Chloroflexota bacterium]|nr:MAG: hypothetical protein BroJett011_59400 [Chloroflexota bacterium]